MVYVQQPLNGEDLFSKVLFVMRTLHMAEVKKYYGHQPINLKLISFPYPCL